MRHDNQYFDDKEASIEFFLLGRISVEQCLSLQQRLSYEAGQRMDGRIDVLMCEHPDVITVGRSGSRLDVRLSSEELRRRQLELKWVARGGGCVLHSPGQLAIYPIFPLEAYAWTMGTYLGRLRNGLAQALDTIRVPHASSEGSSAIWGRSGCLAVLGAAVRAGISYHGAFLNVCPAMQNYGYIDATRVDSPFGGEKRTMGCLVAERRRPARMSEVRAALVESLANAFERERYHLHTGHPLLKKTIGQYPREHVVDNNESSDR